MYVLWKFHVYWSAEAKQLFPCLLNTVCHGTLDRQKPLLNNLNKTNQSAETENNYFVQEGTIHFFQENIITFYSTIKTFFSKADGPINDRI